jgi:glycosyltransferase involved in cell wall biosynthesis
MNQSRALRLFVDGAILKPQLGGIATYIAEITAAVAACPDVEVCLATSTTAGLRLPPQVEVIELSDSVRRLSRRVIWRERNLAALVSSWNASVVLAPTPELPLRRLPVPAMMVVHDLGAVQAPRLYGRLRWLRFVVGIPLACRHADLVVCVSHATYDALLESFPACAGLCTVIGEAGRVLPERSRDPRRSPYVLAVGTLLPHKNVQTLVAAMDHPDLRDTALILAGPINTRQETRFAAWREAVGTPDRISHVGYVDTDRLADLYAGAAVVALPSLHEGFGLTLLEAMRSGAPAVASSIPAHREIGGDAALYVEDVRSPEAWARALAEVLNASDVSECLSNSAKARAQSFTWESIAAETVTLARRLAAER